MRTTRSRLCALASAVTCALVIVPGVPADAAISSFFSPVADTYVDKSHPTTGYGAAKQMIVDNSPVERVFLRFSVDGLSGSVTGARLRLHVKNVTNSESPVGGTVSTMSDTGWSESAVTWNSQPAPGGASLGGLGAVARNTWVELDVTAAVTGNGPVALAVTSTSSNGAIYDTRETGANAPQLVVTTDAVPDLDAAVLVGAGDIASCTSTGDEATAALLDGISGTVFTAGDNAYDSGSTANLANCYDPTWGRHKARTRPVIGNHDYASGGGAPYFDYFGAVAGDRDKGYYSYDLGGWHIVAVNSNCSRIGGCAAGSPQEQWLRQDLAANAVTCTLAIWHHPLYTSGKAHGPDPEMVPIWQALTDAGADVVVTGHNHQYERFAPQDAAGNLDLERGLREFVAGTGGASHYGFGTIQPNSEARNADTYGVLKLTLHAGSYDWEFVPQAGKTYRDVGTNTCH